MLASVGNINAQTMLLSEDFNSTTNSSLPSGWDTCRWIAGANTSPSSFPHLITQYLWMASTGGVDNSRCAMLYAHQNYTSQQGLMTPARQFDATKVMKLCFDMKNWSSSSVAYVGGDMDILVTYDNGVSIADTIQLGINSGTDWVHYEFPLTRQVGASNVRIIFLGKSYHYYFLDNVEIVEAPQCKPADYISISNLSNSGATFSWNVGQGLIGTEATPTDFIVSVYKTDDNSQVLTTTAGIGMSYTVTGLESATQYRFCVVSDCGVTLGHGDTAYFDFQTHASAIQLPHLIDFETGVPLGTFGENYEINTVTTNAKGTKSLKITTTTTQGAFFCTPIIDSNPDSIEFSMLIKPSLANKPISFGLMSNPYDESSFEELFKLSQSKANTWKEVRFNTTNVSDKVTPSMLCIYIESGAALTLYVDSIHIHHVPTCIKPEALEVTERTHNSVTLSWQMANATNYEIIAKNGQNVVFQQTVVCPNNTYTITGLNPNTNYFFSVKAMCSATEESELASMTDSVRTFCDIADSPLLLATAEDCAKNTLPDCWTTGILQTGSGTVYADYPFYTNTTKHSGSYGFQLRNMSAGTIAYLSSQKRDFGSQAGKYSLRIWVNRTAILKKADEGIDLWITPNPDDTVGGTHLAMINRHYQVYPVETAAGWYQYEYLINYTGQGYLTIIGKSQQGAVTNFDDIEIFESPTCLRVADVVVENTNTTSTDLSWTPGGSETQWLVGYTAISSSGIVISDTVMVTSPRCTISGLVSATSYSLNAFVRALCPANDTSDAVLLTNYAFTTECNMLSTLPYTMGFEEDEIYLEYSTTFYYPQCWKRYNDYTGTLATYAHYPYVSTYSDEAHTGSRGMKGTIASLYAPNSIVILPQIDTSAFHANQLRVKFWAREASEGQITNLYLVAMTDPADFSTCVTVDTVTVSSADWSEYQMNLANYQGNGSYIGINYSQSGNGTSSVTTYIDDLVLDYIPACPDIERGISVANLTDTSLTITISDVALSSSWQYAIGVSGTPISFLTPVDAATASVTITGLTPNTSYDIYARCNCGANGYGSWTDAVTATTTTVPATIPYVCNFEDENENGNWLTISLKPDYYSFTVGSDANGVYEGDKAMYVTNGNDVYSYTPAASGISGRAFASRLFHFDSKYYKINLKWKAIGGESTYDYGRILLTDATTELNLVNPVVQSAASNFDVVAAVDTGINFINGTVPYTVLNCSTYQSQNPDANGWCDLTYVLDMTGREGNYNLVLMWNQNDVGGKADYPLAVDDIRITELTCLPASSVVAIPASHSVDLVISQPSASAWEVIVDTNVIDINTIGFANNYVYHQVVTNNMVTVNGLNANTQYYYTLRTICGVNDTSDWKGTTTVNTLCEPFSLPYTEDFESITSVNCWVSLSSSLTAELSRATNQHKSGSASMKAIESAAVTPELIVDSLCNYQLSGWVYSPITPVTLSFMVGTEPTDVTSFSEPLAQVEIHDANVWKEFVVTFDSLSSEDFAEYKYAHYVAITGSGNTLYFDDIEIKPVAVCTKPSQIAISNIGEHQYDITFVDNSGASAWVVSSNDRMDTIYSTTATITGLDAHTDYLVKVAALCSATLTSEFTEFGTIKTACEAIELPYYFGFEVSEGWSDEDMYVSGRAESVCWSALNMQPNGETFPYYGTSTVRRNSGNGALCIYSGGLSSEVGYVVMPAFAAPTNMLKVEYAARDASYTEVEFGYLANPNDGSTFVLLVTHPKTDVFTNRTIMMNTFEGVPSNARLAFRTQQNSGWVAIDDIHVSRILSCSDPNPASVIEVTDSSVKMAVSDTAFSHTTWQYVCVPRNGNPNEATISSVPGNGIVEITGLADDSEYDFYVRAVCGAAENSNWVRSQFTTKCSPFVISPTTPFVDDFESYGYGQYLDDSSCFDIVGEGSSDSYRFRICPNVLPSDAATTIYNYAHDDSHFSKCLQLTGNNTNTPNGVQLMRRFYLEAGKNYVTSAFFYAGSSIALASKFSFILISENSTDTIATMLMNGKSVPETYQDSLSRVVYPFNTQYERMRGFFTVPVTGIYDFGVDVRNGSNSASSYYCYLDDWMVSEYDGCIPSSVALDSVDGTSAYFTIADNTPGHTWEYMLNDTTVGTPIAVNNPAFQITGLAPSTYNRLFVRTLCSPLNHSEWASIDFASACGVYNSYPYNQDFENEFLPLCWTQFYTNTGTATTANAWKKHITTTSEPYVKSGNSCASLPIKANTNTTMVTGAFDMSANPYGYSLSFWMYRHLGSASSYADDILHVLISNQPITPDNLGNATEILAIPRYTGFDPVVEQPGLYKYECDLPLIFNGTVYIAFHHTDGSGSYALYIDDVNISAIPSCRAPKNAPEIIGTTKHTVTASLDMADKNAMQVGWAYYSNSVSSDDIIDSMATTTSTFTVANLDSASEYALFVRYVCSENDHSAWSPYARFTTKETDCFDPANLTVIGDINNHHAELAWFGAPDAICYQYELLRANVLVDSGRIIAPVTSIVFDSLTALSSYKFKVRGFCPYDTTNWVSIDFNTTTVPQTLPYFTNFEDVSRDNEWQIVTPNAVAPNRYIIGNGTSLSGNRSLYISDDNFTYEYQVATSQGVASTSFSYARILIPFQPGNYMFTYDWKCYGQGFTGTTAQDFGRLFLVPIDAIIPTMSGTDLYGDLSSSISGAISVSDNILNNHKDWTSSVNVVAIDEEKLYYLVAAWANNASAGNQPPFAIDNISVQRVECLPVQSVSISDIGANKASFEVNRFPQLPGTSIQYAVSLVDDESSITSVTTMASVSQTATTDTIEVSGLQSETSYYFFTRVVCDSTNVSPWVRTLFTTAKSPIQLPYVCGFENMADTIGWQFVDGQYSWFIIGDAVGKDSQSSLYVTDDGYRNNYTSPKTPPTANGVSYAYIPLAFGPATYEIDFDWKANGASSLDYGRAFLAPTSAELVEDALYSGVSATATPAEWIALDSAKLNLITDWRHRHTSVTFEDSVVMNLVFVWRQNYTGDNQPPLAIDNISVERKVCSAVTDMSYSATTDSVCITAHHSNDGGHIFWHMASDGAYSDTIGMGVTDSIVTVSNLQTNTVYYIRLGVICDDNDTSYIQSYLFRTACGIIGEYPYYEGFENMISEISDTTWYRSNCWTMSATSAACYSYPSDTMAHAYNGNVGLCIKNGNQQYLMMPQMNDLIGKTISFYHKAGSIVATSATLSFGYMINDSYVNLNTFNDKTLSWSRYQATFGLIPDGARLCFKLTGSGKYYLDDIRINELVQGNTYNDTICFNAPYNKHGFICAAGSLFPGDTTLTQTILGAETGVADSIITVNIHVRPQITAIAYDSICAGTTVYNWNGYIIDNPTTAIYTHTFTAACGCDSTVALNLYVFPENDVINAVICQGDSILIEGQSIKTPGTYVVNIPTTQGCVIPTIVNVTVIDSVQVFTAYSCQGDVYTFEGQTYTASGTYRVSTTSPAGCTVVKELHLTVYPTDTTIVTSFCRGGSITVAGMFIINSDTTFDVTIANVGTACSTTYHVTATTIAPTPGQVYDIVCEGHAYSGYGINDLIISEDTVVSINTKTADLCDSVTEVHLTFVATKYGDEYATITAGETYDWHDNTYVNSGDYRDTMPSAVGCDSIVTLHLSVISAVENISTVKVDIVPNPVRPGMVANVYGNFDDVETVEILNNFGQVVDRFAPNAYPIEIDGLEVEGMYYVRVITRSGEIYTEKLLVK